MATVKLVRPRVSYADLERSPEDGRRYELYDGEVFVVPAPLPRHQVVQILIVELLRGGVCSDVEVGQRRATSASAAPLRHCADEEIGVRALDASGREESCTYPTATGGASTPPPS